MMEYYCCGLHHSSYCPECQGRLCLSRLTNHLDPEGGNEEKISKMLAEKLAEMEAKYE